MTSLALYRVMFGLPGSEKVHFDETAETEAESHYLWGIMCPEWNGNQMGKKIMSALELSIKAVFYLKSVNGDWLVDYTINLEGWDQHWQWWK